MQEDAKDRKYIGLANNSIQNTMRYDFETIATVSIASLYVKRYTNFK